MKIKSLSILVIFLLIGAGMYFVSASKNNINTSEKIGSPIMQNLQAKLNDVSELQLIGAGEQVLSTLQRTPDGWTVKERNHFPADVSKIRATLLNLAEAKIIEQKTANSDLYVKLGLEDISAADAQGVKALIHIQGESLPDELIIGNPGPQINKSRYVRLANSETSWLIDRKIDLNHTPEYWLRKDILNIEPKEIDAVTILLKDGSRLEIKKSSSDKSVFEVANLTNPESQVVAAELDQVTNAMSAFQLLDIADNADFDGKEADMQVSYLLSSGAIVNLKAYELKSDHFASLDYGLVQNITAEQKPQAEKYVNQLKALTSGWIYKIPNVTYDSMYKREADVLAITEDQLN